MELAKITGLRGEVNIPGDKSISHRCIMFGSIASGTTEISNFLQGADCLATINCFRKMGIEIENQPEKIIVHGKDRNESIAKMKSALGEFVIDGISTNIDFLYKILEDEDFINNNYDTSFIAKKFANNNQK